ncbi:LysR family transcriptional regulator [Tropicimonas sp. TH_r6]|uniref:LysR family transcriptional regulator n=1 Tax=Tropicimonas sp. TH_r6 TaxID=3082085 RepID=UPI00295453F0|nr:LysR family transcriptional regulator [Tropicimonas sp. TH_r6]MDV7142539.1 LysR family transcriptional regulator [Tropicimonas sp. TH_r6]
MSAMDIRRWDHLRTALAVFKTGSYRAAAEETGLSSMTVGRHIEALETELGAPVFVLRENRWEATDLGRQIARLAAGFGADLEIALKTNTGPALTFEPLEISTISYINMFFLASHIRRWHEVHPDSPLTIDASEQDVAVERGRLDAALRLGKPEQIGLIRQKIATSPVSLFAPHGHSPDHWIGLPGELDDLPEMRMATTHFGHPPHYRLDSYPAVAAASAESGLACILPTCIADHFPTLTPLEGERDIPVVLRELWFLFHERRKSDPAIRALKSWITQIFPDTNRCLCGRCGRPAEPANS